MIKFKKVILHNFGSYAHSEIDLQNKGFCLVTGKNLFNKDNSISNGSGKSTIWSSICFTLVGEMINGVHTNLKNINLENEKDCYVTVYFDFNKDYYEITRIISPKTDLKIIKNGENIGGKTFRESEKILSSELPILTKDLIASTCIIGQGMPNKFSAFTPSGRKELLERLTGSDFMIIDVKNKVTARLNTLNSLAQELSTNILINKSKITSSESQIKLAQLELASLDQKALEEQLLVVNSNITSSEAKLLPLQENLSKTKENLQIATKKLQEISAEKYKVSTQEQEEYTQAYQKYIGEKANLTSLLNQKNLEITRLKSIKDVCPTCGQKLPGVTKPDTSKQELETKKLSDKLIVINDKLQKCQEQHKTYLKQINESFENDIIKKTAESKNYQLQVNNISTEIDKLKNTISSLKINQAKLIANKDSLQNKIVDLNTKIKKLEVEISTIQNEIKRLEDRSLEVSQHIAVVKKIETLITRDLRGYLLENIIKCLDKKAKDFSEIVFKTRLLDLYIDGNNLNISYCNKLFDNLSGGEKQKVDLILQFAIRYLLNKYFNINFNILVLDEITDFLDKTGSDSIMKLLEKELNTIESVFIISHHDDELNLPIDSTLEVIKGEDGISRIS